MSEGYEVPTELPGSTGLQQITADVPNQEVWMLEGVIFFFKVLICSHWSLVDVPVIFFCPADHVPDWQPRVLLGMVEARSVNVKKTTTTTDFSLNSSRAI